MQTKLKLLVLPLILIGTNVLADTIFTCPATLQCYTDGTCSASQIHKGWIGSQYLPKKEAGTTPFYQVYLYPGPNGKVACYYGRASNLVQATYSAPNPNATETYAAESSGLWKHNSNNMIFNCISNNPSQCKITVQTGAR